MEMDVKPSNVMIDTETKKLRLIDFGLAEFYHPDDKLNVRVASRFYKSPELLVNFQEYGYPLDLWSVGCMLAALLFRRDPFFRGNSNEDQLVKIVEVLGSDGFFAYLEKYGIPCPPSLFEMLEGHPAIPWSSFVSADNAEYATPDGIDLLDKLLVYDHRDRLSVTEALSHPFFDSVREEVAQDMEADVVRQNRVREGALELVAELNLPLPVCGTLDIHYPSLPDYKPGEDQPRVVPMSPNQIRRTAQVCRADHMVYNEGPPIDPQAEAEWAEHWQERDRERFTERERLHSELMAYRSAERQARLDEAGEEEEEVPIIKTRET
ncbi:hypothetical protein KIPB_004783 [Kipferlia bialata]|uniref:non-specific serine/threonine protein kinase n=1 Tax=Kipferlia bialata TaxID=797122 RepID=A0A9K3GI15_9EUKA|nr:hypothetical protein KIPB_004783 [Kipferlia bialata]|eukprot:g4783.t1